MKEDLLKIINHYGVIPQLKHFNSEVFELNEAIIKAENKYEPIQDIDHIAEEIADCLVMLYQFPEYYYERLEYHNIAPYEFRTDNYEHIENILKYLKNFQKKELCEFTCQIATAETREQDYISEYGYETIIEKIDNIIYKLKSIQLYYKISDKEILKIMQEKVDRQLDRMKEEK